MNSKDFELNSEVILDYLKRIESRQIGKISPWYSIHEASSYLSVSERSIRRYIKDGKIKSYHTPTGGIRLHKNDMDSFIMFGKPYKKLTRPQKEQISKAMDSM